MTLLCVFAVFLAAMTGPASATTRWCEATIVVEPVDEALHGPWHEIRAAGWTMHNPNQARRNARDKIDACIDEAWNSRQASARPNACLTMQDWPYTSFLSEMTAEVCRLNPGHALIFIDLSVFFEGDTGCVSDGHPRLRSIAERFPLRCTDVVFPGAEVVTPPARIVPPATLAQPPLPNTRIPGNDLSVFPVGAGGWRACMQACQDNDDCRAWTFRDAFRGTENVCLLKGSVSARISDTCCQSGIKR
ncbi:PAN domain-containing protein [Roseivivax sp. CAU 1753]